MKNYMVTWTEGDGVQAFRIEIAEDTESGDDVKNRLLDDGIIPVGSTVDVKEVASTPAVETPVEETPVEETPVEETPVEETPVEETPVEETPAEETPAEETTEPETTQE